LVEIKNQQSNDEQFPITYHFHSPEPQAENSYGVPENTDYSDEEILALLQSDTELAVELLFRRYYAYVCRNVIRIVKQPGIAEDIAQDVFFEIWRRKDAVQITAVRAYLRRAARNKALNYIRDQKIQFEEEDDTSQLQSPNVGVQRQLEAEELQALIDQTIDELPERCRLVFVLSRYENLTYQEIADQLGISIKTVENQISKALKYLRTQLYPYLEDG